MSQQTNPSTCRVIFQPSGRQGEVPAGTNLLDAARMLGVEIEAICSGKQTCGKCQVAVEDGVFAKHGITSAADHLTPPDSRETHYWEKHPRTDGRRMACGCEVLGDLVVFVPEESQARKQIVRKAATERAIVIDPAIRLYYVEVVPPTLEHQLGDWDRIAAELDARFGLKDVRLGPRAARQPAEDRAPGEMGGDGHGLAGSRGGARAARLRRRGVRPGRGHRQHHRRHAPVRPAHRRNRWRPPAG